VSEKMMASSAHYSTRKHEIKIQCSINKQQQHKPVGVN